MIQKKLDRFLNNETRFDQKRYGLDDIAKLLAHFGNPHDELPTIHVAGTNGKGSVSHMLNAILTAAGYRTGLYTSPHLLEINERIRLQNTPIDDRVFEYYVDEITAYIDAAGDIYPTYFDVLTACAFCFFRDSRAECAVIETGLGGRLDSTNIITPICSVLTDISFDHGDILGKTLPAISAEKAGIIKEGVPAVTSNIDGDILGPIASRSGALNAPLYVISRDFDAVNITETVTGFVFDYSAPGGLLSPIGGIEIFHPLRKQVVNASCAITASLVARGMFPNISDAAIRNGIAAFSAPGRFQTLCITPPVIFDPAHNEAALSEMINLLLHRFPSRAFTLVISLMKDKEIDRIMTILENHGIKALYHVLDDQRCYVPGAGDYPGVIMDVAGPDEERLFSSLDRIISPSSLFFFTGSFRLYRTALHYAEHARINCS